MNTQVNWEIASVKCAPEIDSNKNVVQEIEWLATAKNGDFEGSVNGRQAIAYSPQQFVAYEELTQTQMIEWVKSAMTMDRIAEIEEKAIQLMNPIKTEPVEQELVTVKLPWVK
jgi:hypothetical protein